MVAVLTVAFIILLIAAAILQFMGWRRLSGWLLVPLPAYLGGVVLIMLSPGPILAWAETDSMAS
jgi:hypothetical protein